MAHQGGFSYYFTKRPRQSRLTPREKTKQPACKLRYNGKLTQAPHASLKKARRTACLFLYLLLAIFRHANASLRWLKPSRPSFWVHLTRPITPRAFTQIIALLFVAYVVFSLDKYNHGRGGKCINRPVFCAQAAAVGLCAIFFAFAPRLAPAAALSQLLRALRWCAR